MIADQIIGRRGSEAFAALSDRYRRSSAPDRATTRRWRGAIYMGWHKPQIKFASMATVVEQGCAQQFQHFISNSPWDHEPVVAQISQDADRLLGGEPSSCLIIDESSFPKQGERSVGVARQWAGRLGKVDNCQVAVFGVLTDGQRHTPVDVRSTCRSAGSRTQRAASQAGFRRRRANWSPKASMRWTSCAKPAPGACGLDG